MVLTDKDQIHALDKECFPEFYNHYNVESYFTLSEFGIVVEADAHITGYAIVKLNKDKYIIAAIGVTKQKRGCGIGKKLLLAIDQELCNKASHVVLQVRVSNVAALALYLKHGFRIIGVLDNYYNSIDEDGYEMWKEYQIGLLEGFLNTHPYMEYVTSHKKAVFSSISYDNLQIFDGVKLVSQWKQNYVANDSNKQTEQFIDLFSKITL